MFGNFQIAETEFFRETLHRRLGSQAKAIYSKISNQIYPQLISHPYSGTNIKKLKGYKPETWRYRIGDYRLFYEISIDKKLVIIMSIRHRKDAYQH